MRSSKFILTTIFTLTTIMAFSQSPKRAIKKLGAEPVYFMDSVNVDKGELMKYDPNSIAIVTVLKGEEAMKIFGENGKDGAVYIETISFAKSRYWKYFRSKSPEYAALLPVANQDTTIQYILNDKVLDKNFEGNLALINDKVFKEIKVLNKEELQKQYGIQNKEAGVVIKSETPEDLHNGKKKF
ncbi:hypothetical protein SAMN04488511_109202 [Pedobacter suwonensis]|uniref:Uncharacterized protein n=2 Tax=Pedobacter suwonensis TaxID=332999 RepID=A0A1I0TGP0_9SPHI|nr:hypothetical protein SAMN04488511_109202 [Pedobacter suwonensis]